MKSFTDVFIKLVLGLGTTLEIILFSVLGGIVLALLLLSIRACPYAGNLLYRVYTEVMRASPIPIMILLFYFGGKYLLQQGGIDPSAVGDVWYAIAAIGCIAAAYFAEIIRSGIQSVEGGQSEAITACNIPPLTGFLRITLPQACVLSIANTGNLLITIVKMTSVVNLVGINDVFGLAKRISNVSYGMLQIQAFLSTLLIYWILSMLITSVLRILENRYQVITGK